MKEPSHPRNSTVDLDTPAYPAYLLAAFGLFAPLITYGLAVSNIRVEVKVLSLSLLAALYAVICVWAFGRSRRQAAYFVTDELNEAASLAARLDAVDEVQTFFGASLRLPELFRLVSSRINEMLPHSAALLLLAEREKGTFQVVEKIGLDGNDVKLEGIDLGDGLAGMSFLSGEVETEKGLDASASILSREIQTKFSGSAAIPLVHDGATFGVVQLFFADDVEPKRSVPLLETVGPRISPLFLGVMSSERTIATALSDPVTDLPNERAFFMVLENQLAESQRLRGERPLSVIAIDIKHFDKLNNVHGREQGDRILRFVSEGIRSELRRMDFLARSEADEFLLVLPTATDLVAGEIMLRLSKHFMNTEYEVDEHDSIHIGLNMGAATFWQDGETPKQLVSQALERKLVTKSETRDEAEWSQTEYLH